MADVLRQFQHDFPHFIIGVQITGTGDAMAHALDGRLIAVGHDARSILTIGKPPEHDAVFAEPPLEELWIDSGKIADGEYVLADQLAGGIVDEIKEYC